MKIAYLVFAYKNPKLIQRVVERLSCSDSAFFIHIDSKSDINDYAAIKGPNVFFTRRIPVYWGEFSGIQAMLILIREAMVHPEFYEYFVLLSGSEYPLKSKEYIHSFFEENRGVEFMSIVKMPNTEAGKPISRIETLRIPSNRPVRRFIVRALAKLGLARRDYRRHLQNLDPYAGHTWWALTRDACQYVIEFEKKNHKVTKYFENTFAPEEMYFHTILGNSPFRLSMRRNIFYEEWSAKGAHPAMINKKDINTFAGQAKVTLKDAYGSGELLFARKFSDDDLQLVRQLDDML